MSMVLDPTLLQANNQSKPGGHRRVKSLVREFDDVYVKPAASTSTSPSPPPSAPAGHVRRAASISSFSSIPSSNAGSSVSYTSNSRSISPSQSTNIRSTKSTQPLAGSNSAPVPSPIFSKRRISAAPAPILVTRENGHANGRNGRIPSAGGNQDQIMEEGEEENGEARDVFLPMSPSSALPYTVNYNSKGSTPVTPSFTPRSGVDHARKHSRIHERNLSAFFPRPGQEGAGYGDTFGESNHVHEVYDNHTLAPTSSKVEETTSKNRRGHHHRHSLSHNFSTSLDPSRLPSHLYPLKSPNISSPSSMTAPINSASTNYLPVPTYSQNTKYSRLPSTLRFLLLTLSLPFGTKAAITLSCAQIILGATLWIAGQNGESLSTTGLGYLVVFDGMGGLSRVFVEGSAGIEVFWNSMSGGKTDRSVRLPFGPHRLVTLSHFSQAIYLLFSAVYVCKESVEHVLLLHGPGENDGGHGVGHGMGHSSESSVLSGTPTTSLALGIALPVILLGLSAIFSLISAVALKNHHQLSDTVGPSGLSFARPRSQSKKVTMFDLIGNPFTVTIVTFSIGLSLASHVIPSAQLGPLDKVVALLQSIAMFYIAYPAAIATGQVLLQTSPLNNGGQMDAFTSALRDIENHPLVVKVSPPHLWQLTPHPSSSTEDKKSSSKNNNSGRRSSASANQDSMIASTLIATLAVKVRSEASDSEVLSIGRFVKDRCGPAMKWGGEEAIEGELTVEVVREKQQKINVHGTLSSHNYEHSSHQHDHSNHQHQHQHQHHQHQHQHQHSHEGHSH